MPWIRDSDTLELFRAAECADEMPVHKMSTMDIGDLTRITSFPPLDEEEPAGDRRGEGYIPAGQLHARTEADGDVMGGEVLYVDSPLPSPPETKTNTPRVSIAPCPIRLTAYMPPQNYGCVERHMIYRSAFPQDRNLDFLQSLRVESILSLVSTAPTNRYTEWLDEFGISRYHVDVAPNKEGHVRTGHGSLCEAVLFALDPSNHPVYIHCNQGRHRTGCVVACIRKAQQWPLDEILAEYHAYADPKARSGDIALIKAFDPDSLLAYADHGASHGRFQFLKRVRVDSKMDIYDVVGQCVPPHDLSSLSSSYDTVSDASHDDIIGIPLDRSPPIALVPVLIDPDLMAPLTHGDASGTVTTIEEPASGDVEQGTSDLVRT